MENKNSLFLRQVYFRITSSISIFVLFFAEEIISWSFSETRSGKMFGDDYSKYSISLPSLLPSFRSTTGWVCKEETRLCLPHMDFQPVILRLAPASTFTQMHAGEEVDCWVKLCYCWRDGDKEQLITIIEEQYNSLLRSLPGKTLLSCQITEQDTWQWQKVTNGH